MRMIFVNLPAWDPGASGPFFAELSAKFNLEFSGDRAACLVADDNSFVILLSEERFRDFINGEISNTPRTTEVLTSLSAGSSQQNNEGAAIANPGGGKTHKQAMDEGPIRSPIVPPRRSFCGGYRCGGCGAQATPYRAIDQKMRIVVPHHSNCKLWKYISVRWPKLARGIDLNV
jgi:predicted lactoylglutathione lyase